MDVMVDGWGGVYVVIEILIDGNWGDIAIVTYDVEGESDSLLRVVVMRDPGWRREPLLGTETADTIECFESW